MVQLKYFGDSRDYFKYDLITSIFERTTLRHHVFVPMLTEHRDDKEGKVRSKNRGDKSQELLDFIDSCEHKSLKHWQSWLSGYVHSYTTVEPVDLTFFSDQNREAYWQVFRQYLSMSDALVFVDPDTGLETGRPSYLTKMGREKYILDPELRFLIDQIAPSSVLMIYQHLPKNKHIHAESVERKLAQVRGIHPTVHTCAYREDDLAFIFVSRHLSRHHEILGLLTPCYARSLHKYKSLHA